MNVISCTSNPDGTLETLWTRSAHTTILTIEDMPEWKFISMELADQPQKLPLKFSFKVTYHASSVPNIDIGTITQKSFLSVH